jgi:hypothetical protein
MAVDVALLIPSLRERWKPLDAGYPQPRSKESPDNPLKTGNSFSQTLLTHWAFRLQALGVEDFAACREEQDRASEEIARFSHDLAVKCPCSTWSRPSRAAADRESLGSWAGAALSSTIYFVCRQHCSDRRVDQSQRAVRKEPPRLLGADATEPGCPFPGAGQDHRHRPAKDRRDVCVRRIGQESTEVVGRLAVLNQARREAV